MKHFFKIYDIWYMIYDMIYDFLKYNDISNIINLKIILQT